MFVVKNYMTDETVAMCSREEDARAMCSSRLDSEPALIYEEKNFEKSVDQGLTTEEK